MLYVQILFKKKLGLKTLLSIKNSGLYSWCHLTSLYEDTCGEFLLGISFSPEKLRVH